MQWYCRGLRANIDELNLLISEYQPLAVFLQETLLPVDHTLTFRKYSISAVTPPHDSSRPCGGVAIFVNNKIPHSNIPLNTALQAVAVRITALKPLTVCSIYLPPSCSWKHKDLLKLTDQLPPPAIIMGDFNAHNSMWGNTQNDQKGNEVESFLLHSNLCLMNNKTATYLHPAMGSYSSIDLSISHPNLLLDYKWESA